jgi:Fic-DOC domain mobile mystery protein B
MGLKLEPKEGDTDLSPDELDQLIPKHISTRTQLDELEQDNIEDAILWILQQKELDTLKIFSKDFQDLVHKKMLSKVWKWAGQNRTRKTNIGVSPAMIEIERKKLNDDAVYWIENNSFEPYELALRFHHRLVQIHCYPNGNGRHSRIMADIILEKIFSKNPLVWIDDSFVKLGKFRSKYIHALRDADLGSYESLMQCIKND